MGDAAEQEGAHGEADHGLGHVETPLVVEDETVPSDHPAGGLLHHSPAWEDATTFLVRAPDDLDDEVEEGSLVH